MPVRRRCACRLRRAPRSPIPSALTRPPVGVTRPFSDLRRVDLPAPDAPSSTVKAPGSKRSEQGCNARVPPGYETSRSSVRIISDRGVAALHPYDPDMTLGRQPGSGITSVWMTRRAALSQWRAVAAGRGQALAHGRAATPDAAASYNSQRIATGNAVGGRRNPEDVTSVLAAAVLDAARHPALRISSW